MIYFLKKLDLKTILILVLIIVILLMRACTSTVNPKKKETIKVNGKKYVVVKHDIDTVYKPVKQVVYIPG
jgi:ABC-type Fe3+-citrate transport system substrate-binding protein